MTVELHVLYDETVLDHGRRPRNRRAIEGGHKAERHNPMCGDRITIYVRVEEDIIRDVSFEGSACAIALASASLMTEAVRGQTVDGAHVLSERFRRLIALPPAGQAPLGDMGTLAALAGVRQFPIRVKCAVLPWQALRAAVDSTRRAEPRT